MRVPRTAAIDGEQRPHAAANHRGQAGREGIFALLGGEKMDVHVGAARRHDQAARRVIGGVRPAHQILTHAILDIGIPGLADARDLAVAHADIGLDDAQHRIDDGGVFDQHVDRTIGARGVRIIGHAVAHHAPGAGPAFLTIDGMVMLDLGEQRSIAQADFIAFGRAVEAGILFSTDCRHDPRPP